MAISNIQQALNGFLIGVEARNCKVPGFFMGKKQVTGSPTPDR